MKKIYEEILKQVSETSKRDYRKVRKLHRELREYGDGLPLMYRHPFLPLVIAVIAFLLSCSATIVHIIL